MDNSAAVKEQALMPDDDGAESRINRASLEWLIPRDASGCAGGT
jgi:hypothetical protein